MKSLFLVFLCITIGLARAEEVAKKNVLWIYLEDVSGWFSCYGETLIETPNIDALAAGGTRFDRFYVPAGVCSATRSAIATGMMQTSIGAHHHRSCRAEFRGMSMGDDYDKNILEKGITPIPILFREAGYYSATSGIDKNDYNFEWSADAFYDSQSYIKKDAALDTPAWRGRGEGQPFFAQVQLAGGKLGRRATKVTDRAAVKVPPYYPDIPLVREEIAHHYDCLLETDRQVGQVIEALKRDGLYENTVIFLFSDHGYGLHRHKQYLYEGGIRMPCIVAGAGIEGGDVRDDLVNGIDISAASLAVAGISIPEKMEGRNFLAENYTPREFIIAARDRCDYTYERIRAVVTPKYKYLKNYLTDRPYMNPSYKDKWPVSIELRRMMAAGEMNQTQLLFFGETKPAEELYDLANDPHEINNLAGDPAHQDQLARHREILTSWITKTGDQGQKIESEAGLLSALKRWGDRAINPEYDKMRPAYKKWLAENPAPPKKKRSVKKK